MKLAIVAAAVLKWRPVIETVAVMVHERMPDSPGKQKLDAAIDVLSTMNDDIKVVAQESRPELERTVSGVVTLLKLLGLLPSKSRKPLAPAISGA